MVGVLVGVFVAVSATGVLVGVFVGYGVLVGVFVDGTGVLVGVFVGYGVLVGVLVGVFVGGTGVLVGVFVDGTGVLVGVCVAVGVGQFGGITRQCVSFSPSLPRYKIASIKSWLALLGSVIKARCRIWLTVMPARLPTV